MLLGDWDKRHQNMESDQSKFTAPATPIQLDFQAATPCALEVLDAMYPYWTNIWGNPSSRQNRLGLKASAAVELARENLLTCFGLDSYELIFTSGATEANNLALLGYARARAIELGRPGHIITVATEHHAVLDPLRQLQKEGFRLTELRPHSDGLISSECLLNALEEDTILLSIMLANNEIGVIQPINKLSNICKDRGIRLHTDAAQAVGYLPIQFNDLGADFITISGHKIYGPKGIGALFFKPDISLMPLQWGGGQERSLRPGTIPVPLVIGLAKAVEIAFRDIVQTSDKFLTLRKLFLEGLQENISDIVLNGSMKQRLPHNLNITIPGLNGNRLHLDLRPFISCSSGSACSNGSPSHVLLALGLTQSQASASLRLSLGKDTTKDDINAAISSLTLVVDRLRSSA